MKYFTAAVEDRLSEAVLRRLVNEHAGRLTVAQVLGMKGNGYLRKSMTNFAKASAHTPVVVLTDLDLHICAPSLIRTWKDPIGFDAPDLHIRVANKEIEAWIVADIVNFGAFVGKNSLTGPVQCDDLADAKAWLLGNCQRAPQPLRNLLVQRTDRGLRQGLGYNNELARFVSSNWDPAKAADRSDSLRRARDFLSRFAATSRGDGT